MKSAHRGSARSGPPSTSSTTGSKAISARQMRRRRHSEDVRIRLALWRHPTVILGNPKGGGAFKVCSSGFIARRSALHYEIRNQGQAVVRPPGGGAGVRRGDKSG